MDAFIQKNRRQVLQASVFLITSAVYSMLHAARTAWAYSKPTLSEENGFSTANLSWLDFSFLLAYAIGLYLNGWLGDRLKLKSVLFKGLLLTMFALASFAVIDGFLGLKSVFIGMILFMINGLGQSVAFPGFIAILTNWFPAEQRGLVFGAWMTCCNIGNIIGQQLGRLVIDIWHLEWYYSMVVCSGSLLILTIVMMKFLHITPADAGLSEISQANVSLKEIKIASTMTDLDAVTHAVPAPETETETEELQQKIEESRAIGFWEAWKLPGVLLYAIVFTCVKAATSAILYWLPTYLKMTLGFQEETANLLAAMEVGQLLGVIGIGYVSDRLKNRPLVITSSLAGAVILFFTLSFMKSNEYLYTYTFLLFVGGVFVGGPGGLIVGALSSDLSSSNKSSEGPKIKATSTITGIIDGSGSVGSAFLQPLIPLMGGHTFTVYTVLLLVATIVTPMASMQASGKKLQLTLQKDAYQESDLDVPTTPVEVA